MLKNIQLQCLPHFKRLGLSKPSYGSCASAGIDLAVCIEATITLQPGTTMLVPTGLAIYIQSPYYAGMIYPRSGLGHKHGIILGNGVGVIDADYQGELFVSVWNRSNQPFLLEPGMRIAQLVITRIERPALEIVTTFTEKTERGDGGFGSTGLQSATDTTTEALCE